MSPTPLTERISLKDPALWDRCPPESNTHFDVQLFSREIRASEFRRSEELIQIVLLGNRLHVCGPVVPILEFGRVSETVWAGTL